MVKKFVNTFYSGIDKDTVVTKYSNSNMFSCENMRVISNHELSSGALLSVKGNTYKTGLSGGGFAIKGYCNIRDWIIWFVDTDSGARIYKFKDSGADGYDEDDDMILMYSNANLRFLYPIRAIGRYETEEIQKVYFTDTETFFYHLNIAGEDQIDELEVTIGALDLIADVNFATIGYEILSGGNLKAGRIQYAYQLYNVNGSESCFSPASSLINLTSSDDNATTTLNYTGTEPGKNTNKSVKITISTVDPSFDNFIRLRLVAIHYENDLIVPEIRIVGEYNIDELISFSATDSGQSMGSMILEDFRFIQADIIPKTLETKNNYLFLGNILENSFHVTDEEFDSRAFRFNDDDDALRVARLNKIITGEVIRKTNMEADILSIGYENACYCPFNDLVLSNAFYDGVLFPHSTFRYQSDGATIGGEGLNIKYEFVTKQVVIDNQPQRDVGAGEYITKNYNGRLYPYQETKVTGNIENYTDYVTSAEYGGYQRDEIYSFAIVFYDTKGRSCFAKWIGDIRFPNQTDLPFITYDNTAGSEITYANILGIKFSFTQHGINALAALPDVVGWKIVRCERDDANKTIKAAGITSYILNNVRHGDRRLYCCSTVPTVKDNLDLKLNGDRWSSNIAYVGDGSEILETEAADVCRLTSAYAEFSSPEISFYKNISISDSDYIEVVGALSALSTTAVMDINSSGNADRYSALVSDRFRNFKPFVWAWDGIPFYPSTTSKVKDSIIFQQMKDSSEPGHVTTDGRVYSKRTSNLRSNTRNFGLRGTHLFAELDTPFALNSVFAAAGDNRIMYAYYRQDKGVGIYGGTDYSARTGRAYYSASPTFSIPTSTATEYDVYGGDTYIGYMIEYRSLWDSALATNRNKIVVINMYPVESTINLSLRTDDIQKFIPWTANVDVIGEVDGQSDKQMPKYQIQEKIVQGISLFPKGYPQDLGDLYRYNKSYSVIDKSRVFVPEPFDFVETERYDTRIYHSLPKLNGEYIDSWLKYLPNHYIDVESEFGEIERLININARVICLQNTGICVLGINDRSLVKDNNPGSITLGVGGILSRYDYVAFSSGIDRHDAAVGSDETLYYVDAERKRIYMLGEGDVPISAVKGINSQLKKFLYTTIVTGYDPDFAEVFFSIDGETIVYGEFQKAFIGTQSFSPTMYVTGGNNFYTVTNEGEEVPLLANALTTVNWDFPDEDFILVSDGSTGGTVYKHNTGPDGGFYGGIGGTDAYVELIINPEGKQTCMFSTLDFKMEVIDANDNEVSTEDTTYPHHPVFETIKQVVFSNSYQTSTVNVVYGTNIKKIAKGWRMQVPLFTDSKVATRSTRYVDTYLRVKIVFDASTVNRLRLHDVTTYYTPVKV